MPAIDYIHGDGDVYNTSRGPKHQWAFDVEGLKDFAVNEVAPLAYEDYRYWLADNVPEGVIFTVAEYDGSSSRRENICRFSICEAVSDQKNLIKARYGNCMIDGNYRIVAHGNTPMRAHRLYEWWYRYSSDRSVDYAEYCAAYIEKKWTKKKLPPIDESINILLKGKPIAQSQKIIRVITLEAVLSERLNAVADTRQSSIDRVIEQALQDYFNGIDSLQPNSQDNH